MDCQFNSNSFVMMTSCKEPDISIPFIEEPVSREGLTALVMGIDILIIFIFVAYVVFMVSLIKKESRKFDRYTFTITDFALQIKNLPDQKHWGTEQQLRALILD